jgi:hypothetical protein
MNDRDRAQWVDNDEGLYRWWRQHRQSKAAFIRANRAEIDEIIGKIQRGEHKPHYLAYPPTRKA